MEFNIDFGKLVRKFVNYVKPDLPREVPVPVLNSYERFQGSVESILAYRSFDEESNLCFLDDGKNPAIGFIVEYTISESSWNDWYAWLENYVTSLPIGSTVLFGRLSTPLTVEDFDSISLKKNNPLMQKLVELEKQLILETSIGPSLISRTRLNSRKISSYIAIKIPYAGSPNNVVAINKFTGFVLSSAKNLLTKIEELSGESALLNKQELEFLLRKLASPMSDPNVEEDFENSVEVGPFKLFNADYSRYIDSDGHLTYATIDSEGDYSPELTIAALTIDSFPSDLNHLQVQKAIAADISSNSQIVCPYWAYTVVEIIDQEEKNRVIEISGGYSRDENKKPWFYDYYLNELPESQFNKKQLKFLMGLNLYTPPEEVDRNVESATIAFANQGFRVVDEVFLSFPLFLTSFPFQYSSTLDNIKRFSYIESFKALYAGCTSEVSSKLKNSDIPAFSRAGALCGIPFDSLIGTAFIGDKESGRSVLMGCAIESALNQDKKVRILSLNEGYKNIVNTWDGTSVSLRKEETGLNFFNLIHSEKLLEENISLISNIVEFLVLSYSSQLPKNYVELIDTAIRKAWKAKKENTNFSDVIFAFKDINNKMYSILGEVDPTKSFSLLNKPFNKELIKKTVAEIRLDTSDGMDSLYILWASMCLKLITKKEDVYVVEALDSFIKNENSILYFDNLLYSVGKNSIWGIPPFDENSLFEKSLLEQAELRKVIFSQDEDAITEGIKSKRILADNRVVSLLRSIQAFSDSFEVAVQQGESFVVYLIVKHYSQYLLMTSSMLEKEKINQLISKGYTLEKALIKLSQDYYNNKWGSA